MTPRDILSPAVADCVCDFPATCNGAGFMRCTGCGGDLCVCAHCFGHGEIECHGCPECPREDWESDDDDRDYTVSINDAWGDDDRS